MLTTALKSSKKKPKDGGNSLSQSVHAKQVINSSWHTSSSNGWQTHSLAASHAMFPQLCTFAAYPPNEHTEAKGSQRCHPKRGPWKWCIEMMPKERHTNSSPMKQHSLPTITRDEDEGDISIGVQLS
eukprot:2625191-Amphidinium_carterae.1